jgi:prepilin peptidase CpaA
MIFGIILLFVLPLLFAYAAATDLLSMTIPNTLSLILIALFPVVAFAAGLSFEQMAWHGAAAGLVFLVCFALFAMGIIGGGDAKFATVVALWVGLANLLPYFLYVSLLGGALTFAIIWMKSHQMPQLAMRFAWYRRLQDPKTGIPYGIALSIGALIMLPQTAIWQAIYG